MVDFDFGSLVGGVPIKTDAATKDTMDGKAFRIGYQTAMLSTERLKLEQERAQLEQEKALALQQLMSLQAQMAAMQGARAGAVAGMSSGLGYAGVPIGPGGEIPPAPGQMPPEAMPPGMPPM